MTNESLPVDDPCFYQTPRFLVERFVLVTVVGTSVAIVGVVENVFLFIMLARKREHRNSYLLYLMLLAFFDVFVSGAYIPLMSFSLLLDYVKSVVLLRAWFSYMVPMITVSHIAMTSSSFLILAASFERYINTVMPNRTRCLRKYRRQIAAGAVLLGLITKVSLAFEFNITFNEECVGTMSEYSLLLSSLALDHFYNLVWRLWIRNIITILLPFFLLAFMNTRIVAVLQRTDFELLTVEKISEAQRKSRVRAATRTLLLVVFTYLLSNILNVVVTIWEYIDMKSLSDDFLPFYIFSVDIVSLLTILAGALRLPIYLTCQPHLRKEFADFVKSHFRRKSVQEEQLKKMSGIGYTAILLKIGAALIKYPQFENVDAASVVSTASGESTSEEVFL